MIYFSKSIESKWYRLLKLLGGERDEGGCMEERVGINASIQMFLKFAIWKYSQYNILST